MPSEKTGAKASISGIERVNSAMTGNQTPDSPEEFRNLSCVHLTII
jgi:hypothetical protein